MHSAAVTDDDRTIERSKNLKSLKNMVCCRLIPGSKYKIDGFEFTARTSFVHWTTGQNWLIYISIFEDFTLLVFSYHKRYEAIALKSLPSFNGSQFHWATERSWRDHRTYYFRIHPTCVYLGFTWIRKNIGCNCSGTRVPVSRATCVLGLITGTSVKSGSDFKVSSSSKATNHQKSTVRSKSVPWRWDLPTIQWNIKTICIYPR